MDYNYDMLPHEIEANRFAVELLMPRPFIEKEFKKLEPIKNRYDLDDVVKLMSDKFKVSKARMTARLMELKLVKAWS